MAPGANFGKPVRNLVLKVCVLGDYDAMTMNQQRLIDALLQIEPVPEEDFEKEINVQTDIFMKTMNYLQPICPAIVFSGTFQTTAYASKIMKLLKIPQKIINADIKIGLVAMEVAENYTTLWKLTQSDFPNIVEVEMQFLYLLIQLALQTEYTHGDHHGGNMLYNTTDTRYFKGVAGHPLLIDFGRTTKIPPEVMPQFRDFCASHQYTNALKLLCQAPTANEYVADPEYARQFYGWACGDYNVSAKANAVESPSGWMSYISPSSETSSPSSEAPSSGGSPDFPADTNDRIQELFVQREQAIDDIVSEMNELHTRDPAKYPLLPLSKDMKNKVYNGILRGGARRRRRRQTKRGTKNTKKRN
jgi:hypothetical protein